MSRFGIHVKTKCHICGKTFPKAVRKGRVGRRFTGILDYNRVTCSKQCSKINSTMNRSKTNKLRRERIRRERRNEIQKDK